MHSGRRPQQQPPQSTLSPREKRGPYQRNARMDMKKMFVVHGSDGRTTEDQEHGRSGSNCSRNRYLSNVRHQPSSSFSEDIVFYDSIATASGTSQSFLSQLPPRRINPQRTTSNSSHQRSISSSSTTSSPCPAYPPSSDDGKCKRRILTLPERLNLS
jgi:hypothetical protein